jgi:hypothetical protein
MGVPFILEFKKHKNLICLKIGAISTIIGTFLGRYIFVYGGNAYPMSNRFGTGFEKYSEYEVAKEFIFLQSTPLRDTGSSRFYRCCFGCLYGFG